MGKAIKRQRLPSTDSIQELARFWDTHDLTDFEEDMEVAPEPVFVRAKGKSLSIDLQATEAQHLKKIAQSKGVKEATVARQWIVERLYESSWAGRRPNKRVQSARQTRARG